MSPLRNLKERVETDMDISLIELPLALTAVGEVIATEIVWWNYNYVFKHEWCSVALAFSRDNCVICN